MTRAASLALRALRDCGVIRASTFHPGFYGLVSMQLAAGRAVPGSPTRSDYRLTDAGVEKASRL